MEKNHKVYVDIPTEKQADLPYTINPIWKFSPTDKAHGSNLYDSYELQAVTKQLNRAIHGGPFSPYSYYLKSPFCRKGLNRIRRENANTPKTISCARLDGDLKASTRATRGFVLRLWKKVKHGFVRSWEV